jgi:hypothetical protein
MLAAILGPKPPTVQIKRRTVTVTRGPQALSIERSLFHFQIDGALCRDNIGSSDDLWSLHPTALTAQCPGGDQVWTRHDSFNDSRTIAAKIENLSYIRQSA